MAHKKGQGSSRNGRDSNAQYLGVKRFGGQLVNAGEILVRQRVQVQPVPSLATAAHGMRAGLAGAALLAASLLDSDF